MDPGGASSGRNLPGSIGERIRGGGARVSAVGSDEWGFQLRLIRGADGRTVGFLEFRVRVTVDPSDLWNFSSEVTVDPSDFWNFGCGATVDPSDFWKFGCGATV